MDRFRDESAEGVVAGGSAPAPGDVFSDRLLRPDEVASLLRIEVPTAGDYRGLRSALAALDVPVVPLSANRWRVRLSTLRAAIERAETR